MTDAVQRAIAHERAAPPADSSLQEALDFIADWAHDCAAVETTVPCSFYGFPEIERRARAALSGVPTEGLDVDVLTSAFRRTCGSRWAEKNGRTIRTIAREYAALLRDTEEERAAIPAGTSAPLDEPPDLDAAIEIVRQYSEEAKDARLAEVRPDAAPLRDTEGGR